MAVSMSPIVRTPIPVDPTTGWLDYVGAFSGLVGALLAALAIWYSFRQAAKAKEDLIRERRFEFELGLLAEIRRQMSTTGFAHLAGYVGALIADARDETDIPLLRAVVGIKAGPRGQRMKEDVIAGEREGFPETQSKLQRVAEQEVDAAIQHRLGSW